MPLPIIRAGMRALKIGGAIKALDMAAEKTGLKVVYVDTPQSSAIARIGYSAATQELRIVFRDKEQYPEYVWGGVDPEFAAQFMHLSGSKGKFYHRNLQGRGEYRITPTVGSWRLGSLGRRISKKVMSTRS